MVDSTDGAGQTGEMYHLANRLDKNCEKKLNRAMEKGRSSLIDELHESRAREICRILKKHDYARGYRITLEDKENGGNRLARNFSEHASSKNASKENQTRYSLGVEFAITALIVASGIARRRGDLSAATLKALDKRSARLSEEMSSGNLAGDTETRCMPLPGLSESESRRIYRSMETLASTTSAGLLERGGNEQANSFPEGANHFFASIKSRPQVLITKIDTLVSIAVRHYNDGLIGWLIADLNSGKLKEHRDGARRIIEINNGTTLDLPVWEDIVEFYLHRPSDAQIGNLETIVRNHAVDRHLLMSALGPVVGNDIHEYEQEQSMETLCMSQEISDPDNEN